MRSLWSLVILAAFHPATAIAETLGEARGDLIGREVDISGHIGRGLELMDDQALTFRDADGTIYPVVFDAGRTARKSLEGCEFAMFGGGSPCKMAGKAEIELEGSRIRLIIFEVVRIDPPVALN